MQLSVREFSGRIALVVWRNLDCHVTRSLIVSRPQAACFHGEREWLNQGRCRTRRSSAWPQLLAKRGVRTAGREGVAGPQSRASEASTGVVVEGTDAGGLGSWFCVLLSGFRFRVQVLSVESRRQVPEPRTPEPGIDALIAKEQHFSQSQCI